MRIIRSDAKTNMPTVNGAALQPDADWFVNQAPIKLKGGNNLYQFAFNTQMWIDLFGLSVTGAVLTRLGTDASVLKQRIQLLKNGWAGSCTYFSSRS